MPLLSIIIPTFNSASTLADCLNSIANQTFRDFELLIIDGVSKDNTLEIAEEYSSKLPAITIISEPDKGIYDAMNKGIDLANGEWLYFLGSDDSLYSHEVLEHISLNLHSNYALIYGNTMIHPEKQILIQKRNTYSIFLKNICHQGIFYKGTFIKRYYYDLKYPILADWDLNIKLFTQNSKKIKHLDLIISNFNTTATSNNWGDSKDFKENFLFKFKLFKRYLDLRSSYCFYGAYKLSILLDIKSKAE